MRRHAQQRQRQPDPSPLAAAEPADHLAALLVSAVVWYTICRAVWGDLDSYSGQYSQDATCISVVFFLYFSAAWRLDQSARADFLDLYASRISLTRSVMC